MHNVIFAIALGAPYALGHDMPFPVNVPITFKFGDSSQNGIRACGDWDDSGIIPRIHPEWMMPSWNGGYLNVVDGNVGQCHTVSCPDDSSQWVVAPVSFWNPFADSENVFTVKNVESGKFLCAKRNNVSLCGSSFKWKIWPQGCSQWNIKSYANDKNYLQPRQFDWHSVRDFDLIIAPTPHGLDAPPTFWVVESPPTSTLTSYSAYSNVSTLVIGMVGGVTGAVLMAAFITHKKAEDE